MTGKLDRLEKARRIAEAALERKAEDVVVLDVREQSSFSDTLMVASGTSARHVQAIADAVEKAVREMGEAVLGVEGASEGRWILMDLNDVIFHVFQPDVREFYDLERLWSDAECLEFDLPSAEGTGR